MRSLATLLLLLAALGCSASAALAGPPLPGDYRSSDIGGPILTGRYTEGWQDGGGALLAGTTLNAQSWNGSALGTEWRYWCATEPQPGIMLTNTVNASGNGNRTYMKTFTGGYIWLSGTGPWANGDASYPGVIDSYTEFETIQYTNWVPVSAITNVQATAHFDHYPASCLAFAISNGVRVGTTDLGGLKPTDYPDLLAAGSCAPGLTQGAWWDMISITLSVGSCALPAQPTTWGGVKAIYR